MKYQVNIPISCIVEAASEKEAIAKTFELMSRPVIKSDDLIWQKNWSNKWAVKPWQF